MSCCNNTVCCNNNISEKSCCICPKNIKCRFKENFIKVFVRNFFHSLTRCFKKIDLALEKFIYSDPGFFLGLISDLLTINLFFLSLNIFYCQNSCLRFCTIYLLRKILFLLSLIPIFWMISCMLFLASFFLQASSCKHFFIFLTVSSTLIEFVPKLNGQN